MDIVGIAMTTAEVNVLINELNEVTTSFNQTMKNVNETCSYITGVSEGGLIDQFEVATVKLGNWATSLVNALDKLSDAIHNFLMNQLKRDAELKQQLQEQVG